MRFSFYAVFSIIVLILISVFAGYENPKLVEIPKTKIKYFLKKFGIRDSFIIDSNQSNIQLKNNTSTKEEIFANSFTLEIEKIKNLKDKKTAGIFFKDDENYTIFTQNGEKIIKNDIREINLPIDFTLEKNGGVKSVIYFDSNYYALLSRKSLGCNYASLINLREQLEVFTTKCIPDKSEVDFAGLGGAYTYFEDNLILSIGTPTHLSEEINDLAQEDDSLFGKILILSKNSKNKNLLDVSIFSKGHRNPQGLVKVNNFIYSTEHGPQGGDEINLIEQNQNYGWPIVSLGTRYGGKSYQKSLKNYQEPIYSFLPAVAPSSLNECPKNLKEFYKKYTCLLGLTLREMSIIVYLFDKDNRLISSEKILIEKRLRNFGLNDNSKLFVKDNFFYFSADNDGIYKGIFQNFR